MGQHTRFLVLNALVSNEGTGESVHRLPSAFIARVRKVGMDVKDLKAGVGYIRQNNLQFPLFLSVSVWFYWSLHRLAGAFIARIHKVGMDVKEDLNQNLNH